MEESPDHFRFFRRYKRKIVQPYLKIIRKKDFLQQRALEKMKDSSVSVEESPDDMYNYLRTFNTDSVNIPFVMRKTAEILKVTTDSDEIFVWLVEENYVILQQEITCPLVKYKIRPDNVVASHVAFHKNHMVIENCQNLSFMMNFGHKTVDAKAVIVVPVITPEEECVAVIEMYRQSSKTSYHEDDLKITLVLSGWIGAAIQQTRDKIVLKEAQKINVFILEIVDKFYTGTITVDEVITKLMLTTKKEIKAERGLFYIIDPESDELKATVLEQGLYDKKLYRKNVKTNLLKAQTVAGAVARHRKSVLLQNLMEDRRFNRKYEQVTGKYRKCILAIPIKSGRKVYGVLELENKKGEDPNFSREDEHFVRNIWKYASLVLSFEHLRCKVPLATNKIVIHKSILSRQLKPCEHDNDLEFSDQTTALPTGFHLFQWYIPGNMTNLMPHYSYKMLMDLIGDENADPVLCKEFVLMVRGMYAQNPYHNFEHGFNVAHCVYCIMIRNGTSFTPIEVKGLIVSALCHDIEHFGVNNSFLTITNHIIAMLYSESSMENYHYMITTLVLTYCPFITNLTASEYSLLLKEIKANILATDLSHHFKIRYKINNLVSEHGNLNLQIPEHKYYIKCIIMTTADISSNIKQFSIVVQNVSRLYKEFYNQGDIERNMGYTPLPIMNKEKVQYIPKDQVHFMNVLVVPCVTILKLIFANCSEALDMANKVKEAWQGLADSLTEAEMWEFLERPKFRRSSFRTY